MRLMAFTLNTLSHVSSPSGSVAHSPDDDDSFCRKRQRISNEPTCLPVPARCSSDHHLEGQRSSDHYGRPTSKVRDSAFAAGHDAQGELCWTARNGNKITALYAELVRQLEAQVAELHQIVASRDDAAAMREWRIQELEQENQELKQQIQNLEEQNDSMSHKLSSAASEDERLYANDSPSSGENCKSSKGLFLINIPNVSRLPISRLPVTTSSSPALPSETQSVDTNSPAVSSGAHPEGMLRVIGVSSGFQYWMKMEESGENAVPESCVLWDEPLQETLPDGTPAWASPVEINGRPKLELMPCSGVYITYQQLEDLSHIPPDKPKLMTRRLLDYFFSRETLARSSATGQRIAHNNTTMEKPLRLPDPVVTAIKAYVTRACGRGCNFNAVINSKCGTSRRAVKKMSIRIDWTEGGSNNNCPRTQSIASAHREQFQHEKAADPYGKGTDAMLPLCVPRNT
uniref:BEN domain-containing protein n=1 Tax=Leptobrachium leishanense TaxID=445787 RepID=A0A8C5Q8Z7_9ANUR